MSLTSEEIMRRQQYKQIMKEAGDAVTPEHKGFVYSAANDMEDFKLMLGTEEERRKRQYEQIMRDARNAVTPENGPFHSRAYRPYNVERCVYVTWDWEDCAEVEPAKVKMRKS